MSDAGGVGGVRPSGDDDITTDTLRAGRVRIFQPARGARMSLDPVLLEGFLPPPHGRFLDIGCGTGLLAIQLARNGAEHVHAIDIERRAVANTLSNAFRNGVADRMTGEAVDLYPWVPKDRYDVVVASLYQMPVDPYEQPNTHRPLDFWGRNRAALAAATSRCVGNLTS